MKRFSTLLLRQIYYILLYLVNLILYYLSFPFLRMLFLNMIGQRIAMTASIHKVRIKSLRPRTLKVGKRSIINNYVLLDNRAPIIIKDDVCIGEYSKIYTYYHDNWLADRPIRSKCVYIEDGVFIYSSAIILPGVTLGKGSFVAAASVVTKATEEFAFYAGNPAIKKSQGGKVLYRNKFFGYAHVP